MSFALFMRIHFWHNPCTSRAGPARSGAALSLREILSIFMEMAYAVFFSISYYLSICSIGLLSLAFMGCARVAVTPETIRPPDPSLAYSAIEAEPTLPAQVLVRDFDFAPSSVTENRSVFHRATDLVTGVVHRRSAASRSAARWRQAFRRQQRSGCAKQASRWRASTPTSPCLHAGTFSWSLAG